jgi:uncharacterized membrane protein
MKEPENGPRPRLKLKLSSHDYVIEFLGISFLMILIAIPIFYNDQLPEKVPIHFNAAGMPDGFGGKPSLFILPATGLFMYILLTVLTAFPHIYNFPVTITPENAEVQYRLATRLLRVLKAVILILFSFISWMSVRTAAGNAEGLGKIFLPVFLFLISGIIIIYFMQAQYNKNQS